MTTKKASYTSYLQILLSCNFEFKVILYAGYFLMYHFVSCPSEKFHISLGFVLFLNALFWLLFKEDRLEQETPTGASEVEEDMAGVGPEQLKLVFWRELSCVSQDPWPTSHNITQMYLNAIFFNLFCHDLCTVFIKQGRLSLSGLSKYINM